MYRFLIFVTFLTLSEIQNNETSIANETLYHAYSQLSKQVESIYKEIKDLSHIRIPANCQTKVAFLTQCVNVGCTLLDIQRTKK